MAEIETPREITPILETPFRPYDLEGPVQAEITWLPLRYERAGAGSYMMRMAPGAVTIPHTHPGYEDFLILEGSLTDSDGTVFETMDFVSFAPGTKHNSWTDTGCLIIVFERPAG